MVIPFSRSRSILSSKLRFHVTLFDCTGHLEQAIGERAFAVINVSDNTKISNVVLIHYSIFIGFKIILRNLLITGRASSSPNNDDIPKWTNSTGAAIKKNLAPSVVKPLSKFDKGTMLTIINAVRTVKPVTDNILAIPFRKNSIKYFCIFKSNYSH